MLYSIVPRKDVCFVNLASTVFLRVPAEWRHRPPPLLGNL